MKCPYCKSNDIVEWKVEEYKGKTKVYRCYNCELFFEEKMTINLGDNFPVLQKHYPLELAEHKKFKDKGKVPKAKNDDLLNLWIDLWIFLRDKIKENNKEVK